MRYQAYGWDVVEIDGHDFDQIHRAFTKARQNQDKPLLIIAHTIIGKGSPNKAGTNKVHGSALGEEEVKATKIVLGLPLEQFYVPQAVTTFFAQKQIGDAACEEKWKRMFETYSHAFPRGEKSLI